MMNSPSLRILALSLLAFGAAASGSLAFGEEVIYNDPLVINGNLQDEVAAERKQLEKENENLAKQKMEEIRIKEEKKMTDRLQSAFKDVGDKIAGEAPAETPVPAPAPAVVVAPAPIVVPEAAARSHRFSVSPSMSGTVHQGSYENYQEKMGAGADLSVAVNDDWSVALLFDYGQMEISEVSQSQNWYTNWYLSNLGVAQSREIRAKRYSFAIVPKYYLLSKDSLVRPYVGAGAGYSQYDLKYKDQSGYDSYRSYYSGYNVPYGNEEYSGSSLRGVAIVGSEFNLSERFGFNLQCRYAKQISSLGESKSDYRSASATYYNRDEQLIDEIGKDVQEAHQLSFSLGVLFSF